MLLRLWVWRILQIKLTTIKLWAAIGPVRRRVMMSGRLRLRLMMTRRHYRRGLDVGLW
jgi:hypothetical protein